MCRRDRVAHGIYIGGTTFDNRGRDQDRIRGIFKRITGMSASSMSSLELVRKLWRYNSLGVIFLVLMTIVSSMVQAGSAITIAPVIDLIIHPNLQGISHSTARIIGWMGKIGIPTSLISVMLLFISLTILKNCFIAGARYY